LPLQSGLVFSRRYDLTPSRTKNNNTSTSSEKIPKLIHLKTVNGEKTVDNNKATIIANNIATGRRPHSLLTILTTASTAAGFPGPGIDHLVA
jgi:hypothetical protein